MPCPPTWPPMPARCACAASSTWPARWRARRTWPRCASASRPTPADWAARDLLGVRLLLEGDAAAGLDQFLAVLEKARDWNDGAAKKRLLAAFATLDDAELVGRYRRRMASLLF